MTRRYIAPFLLLSFLCFSFILPAAVPADAAVADWQRAVSIQPRWDTDFGSDSFKLSVQNAKAAGANSIALVIPWYQDNPWAVDVHRGWNTPTDEALAAATDYIHSLGMAVSYKIHLESHGGEWRATFDPWNKDMWFASYGSVLTHYARLAAARGVEQMVIGTELITLSTNWDNLPRWNQAIGDIREVYSGALTYSANWGGDAFAEEVPDVRFWGSLDYIGISAYYPLGSWGNHAVESLRGSWDHWNTTAIRPIAEQYGKPVILTEIGYRSVNDSNTDAWNSGRGGSFDAEVQANAYEALFSYWNDHPFVKGAILWDWSSDPNAGGAGDVSYTPQRKPAEGVMQNWWKDGNPVPPPPPPAQGPVSFTASAGANPNPAAANQTVVVTANVQNGANAAHGIVVDLEIYGSAGERVLQRFFEHQSFAANESKSFEASWTPAGEGSYTMKLGVFNGDWTRNYLWNDTAASIVVGSGTTPAPEPPPSSSPAALNMWWPIEGASMSGLQPFKGEVSGRDLSDYSMFWQVDGDVLNEMHDDMTDYPHKEALVDLAGWNWKGEGPYLITFAAKDRSGTTIAAKSANIFVR